MADRWTFTANASGYMFYLDGKPQGGAGTMFKYKGRKAAAQAKSYGDYCRGECRRRNEKLKLENAAHG